MQCEKIKHVYFSVQGKPIKALEKEGSNCLILTGL